jgi:DivIVA domain-containing protein
MSVVLFSPDDVRNERLKRKTRGYHRAQVDRLLDRVLLSYEQVWSEHDAFRERVAALERELASFRESDGFLGRALVTAERVAADVRARAEDEAGWLVEAARAEAREMVGKGQRRWEELNARAEEDARSLVESARAKAEEMAGEAEKRLKEVNARAVEEARSLVHAASAEAQELVDEAERRREAVNLEVERLGELKEEMEHGLRAFVLAALELLDRETRLDSDGRPASSVETVAPTATG